MPAVEIDRTALLGALVAFRALDADTQKALAKAVRGTLTPLWQRQVADYTARARNGVSVAQDAAMVGRGTVSVTGSGKGTLKAYTGTKALTGGMDPGGQWPFVEFGSNRPHGRRGQLPRWTAGGRVFYPAVKVWAPTAARVFLAVVADTVRATGVVEDA